MGRSLALLAILLAKTLNGQVVTIPGTDTFPAARAKLNSNFAWLTANIFSNTKARQAVSATGPVSYNATTGVFSCPTCLIFATTMSFTNVNASGVVNFSNSLLIPRGTTLPSTCTTGSLFFKTDAVAGKNIYNCTATNTWTAPPSTLPANCVDNSGDLSCTNPIYAGGFISTSALPTIWGMIPGTAPTTSGDCPDGIGGLTFCEANLWVRSSDNALCMSVFSDATTVVGDPWCGVASIPLSYLDTDGTMAANSDVKVPSQKAVRTYVAANAGGAGGGIIPLSIHGLTAAATHGSWKILTGTPTWEAYGARGNVIRIADSAAIGNTFILPSTWSGSSDVKLRFTWFQNYDAGATVTFEAGVSCSTDIQATTYTAVTLAETGPTDLITKTSSITLDMTGCSTATTGTVVFVRFKRNAGGSMTNLVNIVATAIEY